MGQSHETSKVYALRVLIATLAFEGRAYCSVILQLWGGLESALGSNILLLIEELNLQT